MMMNGDEIQWIVLIDSYLGNITYKQIFHPLHLKERKTKGE